MHTKLIAAGIGLIGYGALLGWAVTADAYEQRIAEQDEDWTRLLRDKTEQIFDLRDRIDSFNDVQNDDEVIIETPIEEIDSEDENENEEEDEEYDEEKSEALRTNLQRIIDNYTGDEDAVNDLAERGMRHEVDRKPPFVISREKFAWDEEEGDEYEKISLTYYPRERILLDDEEEIIDDVAEMVGWKNLSRFGDESDDSDVVFIRNRRLETDFEVVRDTLNQPPAHVRFGMGREEFEANRAAGLIRFRPEDV